MTNTQQTTCEIGDLSATQVSTYGVVSTVTSIPMPRLSTLRYSVSKAKSKGYIRLNNTLKAMLVECHTLSIGDLLIKHSQSPLRDETMKCITDAITLINTTMSDKPVNLIHEEYDSLVDELEKMTTNYEKKTKQIRNKKVKLDPRLTKAIEAIVVSEDDPKVTPGILLKIDAVINDKPVISSVPNINYLIKIADIVKGIQDRNPSMTINKLLKTTEPIDTKKPQRPPGLSIGDLINKAAVEKNGTPLTKKKPLVKTKTQYHPSHRQ